MKLKLAYYGDKSLRLKAVPVPYISQEIVALVQDMVETMMAGNGIGLAATQVFRKEAIFISCVPLEDEQGTWHPGKLRIFINPKILWLSEEAVTDSEGCMSIPKYYNNVTRPERVRIEALDISGERFVLELNDYEARCIQHEMDHLNGVLFIDHLEAEERKKIEPILQKIKKRYRSV